MFFTATLFTTHWHRLKSLLFLLLAMANTALAQPPCDDDTSDATITYSGPVCPGGTVAITIDLDDDDEEFDITYSIGPDVFVLENVEDGITVNHVVTTTVTATLISIYDIDDDCINSLNESITIAVFPTPTVSISNTSQPSCGQNNGSITATASGGTAPYEYSLNGNSFQSSGTFSDLPPGTYTVTVQDANLCSAISAPIVLIAGNPPTVSISNTSQPSCGQNNGSITATASGGTAPYEYSLDGINYQSSNTFNNLPAGIYTVYVEDNSSCEDFVSVTLNASNAPTVNIVSTTQPTCGQSNGNITAAGAAGTAPYTFSLNGSNFQGSGTFSNLSAGVYAVTVLDAAGCYASQTGIQLADAGAPVLTITATAQPACGQSNGSITVAGAAGAAPYTFSLNGGSFQGSGTFSNLPAGTYTVTILDAAGCSASQTGIQLNDAGAPVLTITATAQPACGQSNGSITVAGAAGAAPYTFSLNGSNFQGSGNFSNLPAGVYAVTVLDAAGCSASQTGIQLNDENAPDLSLESTQAATCAGPDGSLTVVASGGVLPYQFSLNGVAIQANGFFQNLSAGFYNATVTDAAGCSATLAGIEIESTSASLTPASVGAAAVTGCPSAQTAVSGNLPPGTTGVWTGTGVVFENPNAPQTTVTANGPGTFLLTWTLSAPGCPDYGSAQVVLTVPSPPTTANDGLLEVEIDDELVVLAAANDDFSSGASFMLLGLPTLGDATIDGVSGEITYSANVGEAGLDTFSYVLCEAACNGQLCDTALVFIEIVEENCSLEPEDNVFPEGITPNSDGFNDRLHFVVIDESTCPFNYAKSELIIYNRWGNRVFEASPYDNDWDGGNLPHGTYYYVLKVHLAQEFVKFGNVTIFRE
jgi:gliding motility-associated-like protein